MFICFLFTGGGSLPSSSSCREPRVGPSWGWGAGQLPCSGPQFPPCEIPLLDSILGRPSDYGILEPRVQPGLGLAHWAVWDTQNGPLSDPVLCPGLQQVAAGTAGRVSCFFCPDSRHWKSFRNNKQARNICIRNHEEQYMLFKPSSVGNRSKKQLR